MTITISSPDINLSHAMKKNTVDKLKKIFELNGQIHAIDVSIKMDGKLYQITGRVQTRGSNARTIIRERGERFYATLSNIRERMKKNVISIKSRRQKRKRGAKELLLAA